MDDLFLILVIAGIIAFFYFRKKDRRKRNVAAVIAAVSFVLFGLTTDGSESSETATENPEEATEEVAESTEEVDEEIDEDELEEIAEEVDSEEEPEEKVVEEPEMTMEEMRAIDQENTEWRTDVTWENMARTPDDYLLDYVEIEGEVQTVQEEGDKVLIQLMMDGDVDTPVIVEAEEEFLESRILEGDWLTVQGYLMDLTQYQTVLGATVTAPYFYGDFITIN